MGTLKNDQEIMVSNSILKQIDTLSKTPIKDRPRYKAVLNSMNEVIQSLVEKEYQPIWMQEAYVKMDYRSRLDQAREWDSQDIEYQINQLLKLWNQKLSEKVGEN